MLKASASRVSRSFVPGLDGPFVTHVSRRLRKKDRSTLTARCTRTQTRIGRPTFEAFSLGSPSQVMSGPVNGGVRWGNNLTIGSVSAILNSSIGGVSNDQIAKRSPSH